MSPAPSASADPVRVRAREAPGAAAVEWSDGSWSYAELDAAADRLAAALRPRVAAAARHAPSGPGEAGPGDAPGEAGAGEGDAGVAPKPPVVAAFLPPTPEAVATIHGVPRAGAALAPLHADWTESELAAVLSRLRPAVLLPAAEAGGGAESPLGAGRAGLGAVGPAHAREAEGGPTAAPGGPATIHTVVATSGSSGRPRLVALTAGNHLASARAAIRRLGLGPGDRWLASLSFAHVGGLAMALRAPVAGSSLVLRGRFEADAWSKVFDEGGITHASLVPTMLRRILARRGDRRAPRSLACLLLGGAAADPALLEEALDRGWPVALTYGLTEAASQVATAPPERVRRKPGTVGPPVPGTELRVEEGEILVRGPTVMAGYWDERADNLVDGWLRTGDLGRLDGEGDLWVVGRRSARIVTGGVNVDPFEVEAVLATHPGVRDAVVVGVRDPDWGERVVAAVEPASPAGRPDELARALEALCRGRLAGAKRPKGIRVLDRLPRTPTGKADRDAVRRRLEEEPDDGGAMRSLEGR